MKTLSLLAKWTTGFFLFTLVLSMCASTSEEATHWPDCATGKGSISNAHVIIAIDSTLLEVGDIIGGFVGSECVGQFMYSGGNAALTLWRADPLATDKRGFENGDSLHLSIYGERRVEVVSDKPMIAYEDSIIIVSQIAFSGFADTSALQDALTEIAILNANQVAIEESIDVLTTERDNLQEELDIASLLVQDALLEIQSLTAKIDAAITALTGQ